MIKADDLQHLLKKEGVDLAGPVVQQSPEENRYYAFVKLNRNRSGHELQNKKELDRLRQLALQKGYEVELIAVDEKDRGGHSDLLRLLRLRYGDSVRNVFFSGPPGLAKIVWVEMEDVNNRMPRRDIESIISRYLVLYKIAIRDIVFVGNANVPSVTAILRTVRKHAPVDPIHLAQELEDNGFLIPDERWLGRKLDRLRRAGQIVRRGDGRYFLSVESLSGLGTSRRRNSADVQRLLALGRKRD